MTDQADRYASLLSEASTLNDMGRYRDAIERARDAAAMAPQQARPLCELSRALYGDGQYAAATEVAESATRVAPTQPWGFRLLSLALTSQARDATKTQRLVLAHRAVDAARTAVNLAPYDTNAIRCLAQSLSLAGETDEADATIQNAIHLDPDSVATWVTASLVAIEASNWSAGIDAANRALAIDPNNSAALNNLGVALRASGKLNEGTEVLANAARLNPNSTTTRRNLSRAGLNAARVAIMVILIPVGFITHLGFSLYVVFAIASNILISRNPAFVLKMERWAAPLALLITRILRTRRPHASAPAVIDHTADPRHWSALGRRYRVRTPLVKFIAVVLWTSAAVFFLLTFLAAQDQRSGLLATTATFAIVAVWPTMTVRRRSRLG